MKTTWITIVMLGGAIHFGGTATLRAQVDAQVIVNESVAATSLDKAALKDLYTGKTAYWPGGDSVNIVVLTEKTDKALEDVSGMSASQFKTHWQRLTFSGRGKQPKEFDTDAKVMALVAATKGAVALVPAGTALQGVKKLEIK
jgi:ABC-type phosphate transport system substrate-binding protein